MMRRLLSTKAFRSVGAVAAAALTMVGVMAAPKPAAAQEIQLTGPLAGAPACRHCRLYRQGRMELAIGPGFTLLDEYQRTIFVAGRLQYNVFDFLGIGLFGGFGAASLNTDLTDKIDTTAPRNSRTAVNLAPKTGGGSQAFDVQTGKMKWMAAPQVTFSPFRGKLALFQKLFVDTDLYLHGGLAFVGVGERKACGASGQPACSNAAAGAFTTDSRVALAPTFGLGLTLYTSGFVSVNMEYRAFPFSWNRSGFDARGGGPDGNFPDNHIDSQDQTFKFNQMIFLAAGFHLPTAPKVSD